MKEDNYCNVTVVLHETVLAIVVNYDIIKAMTMNFLRLLVCWEWEIDGMAS